MVNVVGRFLNLKAHKFEQNRIERVEIKGVTLYKTLTTMLYLGLLEFHINYGVFGWQV